MTRVHAPRQVPLLHLTADDAELRYVPLPTNEYLWSMRAVAKLVGQDEVRDTTCITPYITPRPPAHPLANRGQLRARKRPESSRP